MQQLPAIHQTLKFRLAQRRCVVHAVLDHAGIRLAQEVSCAPEGAMLAFIKAKYAEQRSTKIMLELARALEVSPFEVAAALRVDLPDSHRRLLGIQVHALDALCKALSRVEARIAHRI